MPFQLSIRFDVETVEFDKFVPTLQQSFRRLMREAAAIYYYNIVLRLPVDTGFLAGSFDALKRASGSTASYSPVNPQQRKRLIYTHFGNRSTPKNPTTGGEYATPLEEILTEITDNKTKYFLIFHFNNEIRYYPINDVHGLPKRPPWRITEKATRAAITFINTNLPNIVENAAKVSVKHQVISYRPGQTPQKVRV